MRQKNIRILSVRPRAARLTFFRCGEEGRDTSFSTLLGGEALALSLRIAGGTGAFQSYIEVRFQEGGGFTFKPEDALPGAPVFSSRLGIAVTDGDDRRDYAAVAAAQKARGLLTRVERAEREPEPSLEGALALDARTCPTFLALPGNARLFEVGFRGYPIEEKQHMELYDYVIPRFNWDRLSFGAADRVVYRYLMGRGMGCKTRLKRSLSGGFLPVLEAELEDGGIRYRAAYFADALFVRPAENPGTHYLEADYHSAAHALTEEQMCVLKEIPPAAEADKPVLRMRVEMQNRSPVSKYAFLRLPHVNTPVMAEADRLPQRYDGERGFGWFEDKIYMTAASGGAPVENLENAWLLAPGETRAVNIVLFFEPVSASLAGRSFADFGERRRIAEEDWKGILGSVKYWELPERAVDEAVKAGALQLLSSCFGERGGSVVAPCLGVYSPIATEGVGLVAMLSSFGYAETAKKCVSYFFAKQRLDGFIQNMVNYMAETGGALYLAGRIFADTRDAAWLESLRPGIRAAVGCLQAWIARNGEERAGGKGMIDGQVADPEDPFRSYSLNALAWAGLVSAGRLLGECGDPARETAERLAAGLRESIADAYEESKIRGVLVPLENGEWAPLTAPWAEGRTGCCLHLDGEIAVTHAAAVSKDSLLGSAILGVFGLLPAAGEDIRELVSVQADLFEEQLSEFSQPYYNVVPYLNLFRGERNAFLREYYASFAALADRETKSFWEHYFLATPHKTSEQGAFLLRTRMMLYYEREGELVFLAGIPRAWLGEGKRIHLRDAVCAFGSFTLTVTAEADRIAADLTCRWREGEVFCRWRLPGQEERTAAYRSGSHRLEWRRERP